MAVEEQHPLKLMLQNQIVVVAGCSCSHQRHVHADVGGAFQRRHTSHGNNLIAVVVLG
jgi:hypothetical protein